MNKKSKLSSNSEFKQKYKSLAKNCSANKCRINNKYDKNGILGFKSQNNAKIWVEIYFFAKNKNQKIKRIFHQKLNA